VRRWANVDLALYTYSLLEEKSYFIKTSYRLHHSQFEIIKF